MITRDFIGIPNEHTNNASHFATNNLNDFTITIYLLTHSQRSRVWMPKWSFMRKKNNNKIWLARQSLVDWTFHLRKKRTKITAAHRWCYWLGQQLISIGFWPFIDFYFSMQKYDLLYGNVWWFFLKFNCVYKMAN